MSRTFMIMAAATGVEDFGSGITRTMRALAFAETTPSFAFLFMVTST